jgi:hypothetical protein
MIGIEIGMKVGLVDPCSCSMNTSFPGVVRKSKLVGSQYLETISLKLNTNEGNSCHPNTSNTRNKLSIDWLWLSLGSSMLRNQIQKASRSRGLSRPLMPSMPTCQGLDSETLWTSRALATSGTLEAYQTSRALSIS